MLQLLGSSNLRTVVNSIEAYISFKAIEDTLHGSQIKYSSFLMLISLSSLATTSKFQKIFCFKMRAAGLININTKECKGGRHLCKWSIMKLKKNQGFFGNGLSLRCFQVQFVVFDQKKLFCIPNIVFRVFV